MNCLSKLAGAGGSSGKDPPPIVALVAAVVAVSCIRDAAAVVVGNRPSMGVYFALRGF